MQITCLHQPTWTQPRAMAGGAASPTATPVLTVTHRAFRTGCEACERSARPGRRPHASAALGRCSSLTGSACAQAVPPLPVAPPAPRFQAWPTVPQPSNPTQGSLLEAPGELPQTPPSLALGPLRVPTALTWHLSHSTIIVHLQDSLTPSLRTGVADHPPPRTHPSVGP